MATLLKDAICPNLVQSVSTSPRLFMVDLLLIFLMDVILSLLRLDLNYPIFLLQRLVSVPT